MPWSIVKGGGSCTPSDWAVLKDEDGSTAGCHDTRAEAQAQVDALYASESDGDGADMDVELPIGFQGVVTAVGRKTGDGRYLVRPEGDEVLTRDKPWPMTWSPMVGEGHEGMVVGSWDKLWLDGDMVMGKGTYDLGTDAGRAAARELALGHANGVSMDPDDVMVEERFIDADGNEVAPEDALVEDDDGWLSLADGIESVMAFTRWRFMGSAQVAFPAFNEARLEPVYATDAAVAGSVIVAAATSQVFAMDTFEPIKLDEPTPVTVDADGRVSGHIYLKGTCYQYAGGNGTQCVTAPLNGEYGRFHLHGARMEDGTVMPVGVITFGEGHVAKGGLKASQAHYANVGTQAAKVRVYEDAHGIAVVGQLLDGVNPDFLLAPMSGHWEPDPNANGALRLIAVHAVNTPGFSVPRLVASFGDDGAVAALQLAVPRKAPRRSPEPKATPTAALIAHAVADGIALHEDRQRRKVRVNAIMPAIEQAVNAEKSRRAASAKAALDAVL
jgi:hypothetical protein